MENLPTQRDLESIKYVIEQRARWLAGEKKLYIEANNLRDSWKKTQRLVENILREAFLKNG